MKRKLLKMQSCATIFTFALSLVNITAASRTCLQDAGPDGIVSIQEEL
ncbi:MAG: hypothetical protein ACYS83_05780 [Planctomycetota bacterium]